MSLPRISEVLHFTQCYCAKETPQRVQWTVDTRSVTEEGFFFVQLNHDYGEGGSLLLTQRQSFLLDWDALLKVGETQIERSGEDWKEAVRLVWDHLASGDSFFEDKILTLLQEQWPLFDWKIEEPRHSKQIFRSSKIKIQIQKTGDKWYAQVLIASRGICASIKDECEEAISAAMEKAERALEGRIERSLDALETLLRCKGNL